jgi:2-polyprenyl-3-methyl-5-hydroxy-6-metoxy-1,4-benzoquinol methylase
MPKHDFSPEWYSIFLNNIPATQTDSEVAFIARQFPLETHRRILDICCGPGRHANPLARLGYEVLGIDNNAAQIARAKADPPATATFHTHDIRDLRSLGEEFDGVINMWASFGYFDDATNQRILGDIAAMLRPGGRVILDVYNRDHMRRLAASETAERSGVTVRTKRSWAGNRMRVVLTYGTGAGDDFDWYVYTPSELAGACRRVGLEPVLMCAWFKEDLPAAAEHARMQLVLERR